MRNGHTKPRHGKLCQCRRCVAGRKTAWLEQVDNMGNPRAPAAPDQMIPVRAHWRRGRYKTKDDKLREFIERMVRGLVRLPPK